MRKIMLIMLLAGLMLSPFMGAGPASGAEVDVLINKLVEKGILTQEEARVLLMEMQKESAREDAQVKQIASEAAKEVAQKESKPVDLPKWVKNTKLKGDVRLRYQHESKDNDGKPARDRWRVRYRLYGEHKITDQWKAGWGFASGGDDPRSTNQTLDDAFSTPDIRLDVAYAKYAPWEWLGMVGGKFKQTLWTPKDLLWDSDIRFEGFSATFDHKFHPDAKLFFTPAFLVLNEFKEDREDPWLVPFQVGVDWKISDIAALKAAGTYYMFNNVATNAPLFESAGTNSTDANGDLFYDYDSVAFGAELGFKTADIIPFVPKLALFGEYVMALDSDDDLDGDGNDDDTGYLIGVKFGHSVKKFGDWQFKYNYRRLERDAWPDAFPDSDFFGGATNVKGHEAEFKMGLTKHITLGVDYYFSNEEIRGDEELDLVQLDLVLKW